MISCDSGEIYFENQRLTAFEALRERLRDRTIVREVAMMRRALTRDGRDVQMLRTFDGMKPCERGKVVGSSGWVHRCASQVVNTSNGWRVYKARIPRLEGVGIYDLYIAIRPTWDVIRRDIHLRTHAPVQSTAAIASLVCRWNEDTNYD